MAEYRVFRVVLTTITALIDADSPQQALELAKADSCPWKDYEEEDIGIRVVDPKTRAMLLASAPDDGDDGKVVVLRPRA